MYKTIVVHLSGAATSGTVEMRYLIAAGAQAGAMMRVEEIELLRAAAEQQLRAFEQHCRACGVASFEARMLNTSAAGALLLQSNYCDLPLAGAFGHSRLHDWVLGSTTRGLIKHARIPLMMTH
jgi:nucleotide-binding universal stress UspA family protein